MIAPLLLALLAGALTVLNPCVLPVLPLVLATALDEHRLGPLAFAGGLIAAFCVAALVAYGAGAALGLPPDGLRYAGAALMTVFGIVLLVAPLKSRFAAMAEPWMQPFHRLLDHGQRAGLSGQFLTGALLGVVWSPCTGPTLGSALSLAAQSEHLARAAAVMAAFAIGASVPLVAIAYGSRRLVRQWRPALMRFSQVGAQAMGAGLLLVGLAILSGIDRRIETIATDAMPEWLLQLTTRF